MWHRFIIFWTGLFLVFMSLFHGLRLDDDSYAHYAVSVQTVSTLDGSALATDTWNKPLPGIAYGLSGLPGIFFARLASVLMILGAVWIIADILQKRFGWGKAESHCLVVACFVFQVSFLPQAFLTMTEQLAAVMFSVGLWLYWVKRRLFWAGICFGLVTWARMEAAVMVVGLFIGILLDQWRANRSKAIHHFLKLSLAAAVPVVGWWIVATIITGTPFWFRTGYVYVREPFFDHLLSVNAVTGLPGALSAAQLTLLLAGLPVLWKAGGVQAGESRSWRWALLLALVFQFVFFSITTVYPRSSDYGGWAIAPLNARSYNILAPVFCLISAAGVSEVWKSRRWRIPACGALLLLVSHYFFQGGFPFLFSFFIRIGYLGVGLVILIGFCFALWIGGKCRMRRNFVCLISGYIIFSAPLMMPFFWSPLSFQDVKADVQHQFVDWYNAKYSEVHQPPRVLQSINGQLDFFAEFPDGTSQWSYPEQIYRSVKSSEHSACLILIETDGMGHPAPLYPSEMLKTLEQNGYKELARFVSERGKSRLDRMILLLSSRNRPNHLVVFAKP